MWYSRINSFLTSLGFTKSKANSNLYYKFEEGNPMILLLYVDYLFVVCDNGFSSNTKRKLVVEFEMKDLGMTHYFLRMEVWQNVDGISLGQGKYEVEILKRFRMVGYKVMTTPTLLHFDQKSDNHIVGFSTLPCRMYDTMIFF